MNTPTAQPSSRTAITTGGHVLAFTTVGRAFAFTTGGHVLATTVPRHPETHATTAESCVGDPVATRFGASSPVLGDALVGGRSATVGPAHLEAARDPVPRQVRRTGAVAPT